jgi:PiT family inorganic phosphate transporter
MATWIGMPISTTHGLVGALIGAGLAAGSTFNTQVLGNKFSLPLLASPIIAIAVTAIIYPVFRMTCKKLRITENTCLCAGSELLEVMPGSCGAIAFQRAEQLSLTTGELVTCRNRFEGRVLGINAASMLDKLHFLSAGVVSFPRGLNDTPKIAALLLAPAMGSWGGGYGRLVHRPGRDYQCEESRHNHGQKNRQP